MDYLSIKYFAPVNCDESCCYVYVLFYVELFHGVVTKLDYKFGLLLLPVLCNLVKLITQTSRDIISQIYCLLYSLYWNLVKATVPTSVPQY